MEEPGERNAEVSGAVVENADAENTDAGYADAGSAVVGSADVGSADAGNADAGSADTGSADAGNADVGSADVENADAGNADVENMDAGSADVENADVRNADVENADVENTDAGNADAGSADAGSADVGNADTKNNSGTNGLNNPKTQPERLKKGYQEGPTVAKCILIIVFIVGFIYMSPSCSRRNTYTFRIDMGSQKAGDAQIGQQYYEEGDYQKAAEYYQKAADDVFSRGGRYKPENGPLYYNLGIAYFKIGDYEQAVKYLGECADVDQRTSNTEELAWDYFAMGRVYREAGNNEDSVTYYQKGLKAIRKVGGKDSEDAAEFLIGLGDTYKAAEEYDKALDVLEQALEINEKYQSDPSWTYIRLARVYENKEDYTSAETYYNKAAQESSNSYTQGVVRFNLGQMYQDNGEPGEAFTKYQEALELVNKDGGYEIAQAAVLSALASVCADSKNDLEHAIQYAVSACRIMEQQAPLQPDDQDDLAEYKEKLEGYYGKSTGDSAKDSFEAWYLEQMKEGNT